MKRLSLKILLALFLAITFCPQNIARSKRVTATKSWIQEDNMTALEAVELARIEAKKEALRLAGIQEHVWSVFGAFMSSEKQSQEFYNAYSEQSFVFIDGILSNYSETVTKEWNAEIGKPMQRVTVTADVDVDKCAEDLTYKLQVEGLKDLYANGEDFNCSVRIFGSDSFLKVFYFDSENAGLIYPLSVYMNEVYTKDTTYQIPEGTSFAARRSDDSVEANVNIVFVATKKNYPFAAHKPDAKAIIRWIYDIPADERTVEMRRITIR